jgi:hypothetical protein
MARHRVRTAPTSTSALTVGGTATASALVRASTAWRVPLGGIVTGVDRRLSSRPSAAQVVVTGPALGGAVVTVWHGARRAATLGRSRARRWRDHARRRARRALAVQLYAA